MTANFSLNKANWQPSATLETLKARAEILWTIHQFFRSRQVIFVETPLLSRATTTDLHLTPFACRSYTTQEDLTYFLCTSPEFPMKRLLCDHGASIYQITKAFRSNDQGQLHNPEFTILEWYRLGFSPDDLMQETIDLLSTLYNAPLIWNKETYQNIFQHYLNIDPLTIATADLKALCEHKGLYDPEPFALNRNDYLNFLFGTQIEPFLGNNGPMFVTHFPKDQALLAAKDPSNDQLALRFELYHHGIELANGFFELQNVNVLKDRITNDCALIEQGNLLKRPIDEALIAAHESGLPRCSGIALGVDRLCMQLLKKTHIAEVLSFSFENA